MKKRCYSATNASYGRYGGRGITVCQRWLESFENFYQDMGPRPGPGLSLERKDNDGNYEPGNCRWATAKEQQSNRSTVRLLEYQGRRLPIAHWSEITGISRSTLLQRINLGWNVELALTTPPDKRRASKR